MGGIISHSAIEEIRLASDIVAVVGSYFNLQRSGAAFKALCPFHKEKTPSFTVNQQRQIFHCFGCGAGGDVFRFVMDYEKVDFVTAVKMLAQRAGIRLSLEERRRGNGPGKEALYTLLEKAAIFYHQVLLKDPAARPALGYLKKRGFALRDVEDFTIGFAPDRWDALLRWAEKEKYGNDHLEAAGLIVGSRPDTGHGVDKTKPGGVAAGKRRPDEKSRRYYDRFRNRLMFPVHDELGRVVGFSARVIEGSESGAKYINTPETELFHKGRLLYGLHRARREIAQAREAVVCEGQLDVIRCHQAGFKNAVAPQGTAFTDEHARVLKRYADSVLLAFDADQAGRDSALRAADILLQAGMAARIAKLPPGEDPGSLIGGKDGHRAFKSVLRGAVSALDFLVDLLVEREKMDTEVGMLRVVSETLDMIGRTPDAVQRDVLFKHAAERLGLAEASLRDKFQKRRIGRRSPADPPKGQALRTDTSPMKEAALARHLVVEPSLAGLVRLYLPLGLLTDGLCRRAVEAAIEATESGEDVLKVISRLDTAERRLSGFAAGAIAEPARAGGALATNEECVKSLILGIRTDALKQRMGELDRAQAEARRGGGPEAGRKRELEMEYCRIAYDIAKLKKWETAVPIMECAQQCDGGSNRYEHT